MPKEKQKFGTYMVENGYLTKEQAIEVLNAQNIQDENPCEMNDRFGRIAVEKGFISEKKLREAFLNQAKEESVAQQ